MTISNSASATALQTRERHVRENMALMQRYFELLFSKELDSMLEIIDDNIEWFIVATGDVIRGKDQFAALAKNHWGASPDRSKKLINLFASEDYACMEYTSGGTLTGRVDFPSIQIPPSGLHYELQVCFVFHIVDGKIDRVHEYFDMETVKRITAFAANAAASPSS